MRAGCATCCCGLLDRAMRRRALKTRMAAGLEAPGHAHFDPTHPEMMAGTEGRAQARRVRNTHAEAGETHRQQRQRSGLDTRLPPGNGEFAFRSKAVPPIRKRMPV